MLDDLWFNKVSRNAESPEDVENALITFKINVQMDWKRIDESDIKVQIASEGLTLTVIVNVEFTAGPIATWRQASSRQVNGVACKSQIFAANQLGRARVKCRLCTAQISFSQKRNCLLL